MPRVTGSLQAGQGFELGSLPCAQGPIGTRVHGLVGSLALCQDLGPLEGSQGDELDEDSGVRRLKAGTVKIPGAKVYPALAGSQGPSAAGGAGPLPEEALGLWP